jgi:hypothetical protein
VRVHQTPVSGLAKRREGDRLLGPLHGLLRIARAQARLRQSGQRTAADFGELTPLLVHPGSFVAGQEGLPKQ